MKALGVLTIILDFGAHRLHLGIEDLLYQWHAASTTCTCLGARLDFAYARASPIFHHFADVALADIMARADLGIIRPIPC